MSDEQPEEETPPAPLSALYPLLRKIALAVAILFVLWTFSTKSFSHNPHPPKTPDKDVSQREATPEPKRPSPATQKEHEDTTQLRDRIEQLEARIKQNEEERAIAPAANSADQDTINRLQAQLAEQDKELQAVKKQLEEMQTIKARLDAMQAASTQQLSALTEFGIMKDAALRGEAFVIPLNQMNPWVQDDARVILDQLKPYAETSVATAPILQNRFHTLLPQALHPNRHPDSWTANLQSLITIRKIGEQQQGKEDEAVIARAEAKIDRSDIDGGMRELGGLSPSAAAVMAPWLKDAQAHAQVAALMNALQLALSEHHDPSAASPAPASPPTPTLP